MILLKPEEFDMSYFDGNKAVYRHNAGYSKYERWRRHDGVDSLGEYWKDYANKLKNTYDLVNKKVLEIGCAKGFVVEDLREMGVDAYGLDISTYAIREAAPVAAPYLIIGDARVYLSNYKDGEFDVVFSSRFMECFSDEVIPPLISEMNRISKFQFHVIEELETSRFYNIKTLEKWLSLGWPEKTLLISLRNPRKILIK